ncbi:MAG: hypothetical protein FWG70_08680 [Oscillospiraceae bacterium]|nr:hypothetical protein [Oscillospiraceae bacterium]
MNKKRIFASLVAAVFMLTACSKDGNSGGEPTPADNPLIGTWSAHQSETDISSEMCFNEKGEVYQLLYHGYDDNFEIGIIEGIYKIEGDRLLLTSMREIRYGESGLSEDTFDDYDYVVEFAFLVDGDTLVMIMQNETASLIRSEPSGIWDFGREIPETFTREGLLSTQGDEIN